MMRPPLTNAQGSGEFVWWDRSGLFARRHTKQKQTILSRMDCTAMGPSLFYTSKGFFILFFFYFRRLFEQ
jgi:hypothetical protein